MSTYPDNGSYGSPSRRRPKRNNLRRIVCAAMHTLMDHRSGRRDITQNVARVVGIIRTLRAAAAFIVHHRRLARCADPMLDAWLDSRLADRLEHALVEADRRRGEHA